MKSNGFRFLVTLLITLSLISGILQTVSGSVEQEQTGSALIPGHSGDDYVFTGNYADGQIVITSPGVYYLTDNLVTNATDYAILVSAPHVFLDGNGFTLFSGNGDCYTGVHIGEEGDHGTVTNFSIISKFYNGIFSFGEYVTISNITADQNRGVGIRSVGDSATLDDNRAMYHGDVGIFSYGHNSTISNSTAAFNRNGFLSQGNYATIFENLAILNTRYGIAAGGSHVGPEPGEEGHGYYAHVINNYAILNTVAGIYNFLPHATIQGNAIFMNEEIGIRLSAMSNNTTVVHNSLGINPLGVVLSDYAHDLFLYHNRIYFCDNATIQIDKGSGLGGGVIYDNYLEGAVHVQGAGQIGRYLWTNPAGPTPGLNIVDGRNIAGNYWSSPERNGWSDLQEPNITGYSLVPYEVVPGSGVYDTAPLVWPGEEIASSSDEWTSIHPYGNITYPIYSDARYFTQAKPGAILEKLMVDGDERVPPDDGIYDFEYIIEDHSIETIGSPAPGQMHVRFSCDPVSGSAPLTVRCMDQSVGDPVSWYWQFGDGTASTEQNPEHTYTTPGTYTVSLRAYNDQTGGYSVCNGCIEVTG